MNRRLLVLLTALMFLSFTPRASMAQSRELKEGTVIRLDGTPSLGAKDAKVVIVEFSDYQCPYSGQYFNRTMGEVIKEYVQSGKVRYLFRDFPLELIHPKALKAAEGAYCAGEQGKYWEMHDRLLRNQGAIAADILPLHAEVLGLNVPWFRECLESGKYAVKVQQSVTEGKEIGIRGSPVFFLGLNTMGDSKLKATISISGAKPYATFKEAIDRLLAQSQ